MHYHTNMKFCVLWFITNSEGNAFTVFTFLIKREQYSSTVLLFVIRAEFLQTIIFSQPLPFEKYYPKLIVPD